MQDNGNKETVWWQKIRIDELETALEIFPNRKNLKILEIGGRDGFQANIISKKGHKVTSIDINPLSPQIHLVQKGDITKLNFEDDSFDLIYSSNMLQEIHNIDKAFMEMKRVLKKDGIFLFSEHGKSPDDNIYKWQKRLNPIQGALFGGCQLDVDIQTTLNKSKFKFHDIKSMYVPGPKFLSYHYWGTALKK